MEFTDFNRAWMFFLGTSRHGVVVSHLRTLEPPKPNPAAILEFLSSNPVKTEDTSRVVLRSDGASWELVYDEYSMIATLKPVYSRWNVNIEVRGNGDKFSPAPMDHISVCYAIATLLGVDTL